MRIFATTVLLGIILILSPEPVQSQQRSFHIGILPERNIFQQYERYAHLAEYISDRTGIPISITVFTTYGDIIDGFVRENLDAAFFGSITGVLAHERLDVEAIVRPVGLDGKDSYHGHIIVRKDSRIRNLGDMKGKVIAFVDRASSCGYIFPLAFFRKRGVTDIDSFFREYYFTGSHDAAIEAVLNRKADVAAAKNTVYEQFLKTVPAAADELTILAESGEFPRHSLFIKRKVDADLVREIKETLLEMDSDERGVKKLKAFGALRFVEADIHTDYRYVHEVAKEAGIDLKTYHYSP